MPVLFAIQYPLVLYYTLCDGVETILALGLRVF